MGNDYTPLAVAVAKAAAAKDRADAKAAEAAADLEKARRVLNDALAGKWPAGGVTP